MVEYLSSPTLRCDSCKWKTSCLSLKRKTSFWTRVTFRHLVPLPSKCIYIESLDCQRSLSTSMTTQCWVLQFILTIGTLDREDKRFSFHSSHSRFIYPGRFPIVTKDVLLLGSEMAIATLPVTLLRVTGMEEIVPTLLHLLVVAIPGGTQVRLILVIDFRFHAKQRHEILRSRLSWQLDWW